MLQYATWKSICIQVEELWNREDQTTTPIKPTAVETCGTAATARRTKLNIISVNT